MELETSMVLPFMVWGLGIRSCALQLRVQDSRLRVEGFGVGA